MASRSFESCEPITDFLTLRSRCLRDPHSCASFSRNTQKLFAAVFTVFAVFTLAEAPVSAQMLLKPGQPGETVNLMPSDLTVLEAGQDRKDLPCNVTQRKPDLGFDLRFHAGFDVSVPLSELAGDPQLLTVVFRVVPSGSGDRTANFVQHFTVPAISDDAKGDAILQGVIDLGEGSYHVDWLMRDRDERVCATSWDIEANLAPKDKPIPLFLSKNRVEQAQARTVF